MTTAIEVRIELPRGEACALVQALRASLRQALQERWFDDRYRCVPAALRTGAILAQCPGLAAQTATLAAVQAALREPRP